jgi:hypothetical protein
MNMRNIRPRSWFGWVRGIAVLGVVGVALMVGLGQATAGAPSPQVEGARGLLQIDGREYPAVVARVNDRPISGKALARQVYTVRQANVTGNSVQIALDQLIVREVLFQEAAARGIVVSEAEARNYALAQQRLAESADPEEQEAFALYLDTIGVTPAQFADSPVVIETYRSVLTLGRVKAQITGALPTDKRADPVARRAAVATFVAQRNARVEVRINP